ncbi:protein ENHANCED DISEASE RESISTANCE 2-like isoform X1 [Triticum urartu]|uniref:START domain-containing protein n=5 Tax=Triticum TaxID=4564 RepID=A0A3B6KH59_WHEAT|nr:protein ENHANCED DISEASE RESISTANCE 2-like isoform X1 [Triticum dicoccoides]XP_044380912.1 protein ENHANCED DISEASE RESISTANCE 2-like isoform X1 [Triticum aestivum]XP_048529817.1 protein ENHANCED DISEASE RESISTANCE 2-like isoform X1 [Triticum urartu]
MAATTAQPPSPLPPAGEVIEVENSEPGSPDAGSRSSGSGRSSSEYSGWVYHLGVNSIGHEYCHLRFLVIRGKCVAMYKRDPHDNPGLEPIRKGFVSHTLVVEEVGRKKVNHGDVYVLRLYSRLDQTKKGEIACATPGEAQKWTEAFEQAKQQAEYDLTRGANWNRLQSENEFNLDGHRPRVRRGLGKLVRIGKGPEMLLRQSSDLQSHERVNTNFGGDTGDALEAHEWRFVRTLNGIRIFEDIANSKGGKGILLKSIGVVGANPDTVFEMVLSRDKHKRHEWDMLISDLELVETIDGYCDVVYGTYEPKYLNWWKSKKDFVFSRQWFRGQDGAYNILQSPASHKQKPPRHGYERTHINPTTWEIKRLNTSESTPKCIVTRMVEISPCFWDRWRRRTSSNFERSIPFALLSQVAGLREYFAANPAITPDLPSTVVKSKVSESLIIQSELEYSEPNDEFYDALVRGESFEGDSDDDDDDDDVTTPKAGKVKLKNVSWAIAGLAMKRTKASLERSELVTNSIPIAIDSSHFHGTVRQAKSEDDPNSWSSPGGEKFMIRGKTYLTDYAKIAGGDPLLKLIAVDWFKVNERFDSVALHPKSLVQSEAAKKIPFILVVNLQVPAKPNYNLVMYYAAEKPVNKDSLLGRFIDGTDAFRDARFKLIPSIVEGYWMVKRAVGTRACLLGKAVTCNYLRQDNFLEIDVDIGSSSVARSIIGLVLGYVTSIVVDLAILVEAKEEKELPEYILGTVRLNRVNPEGAVAI